MFRGLESKVNLVNSRAKLLEFLDDEIIDALAYHDGRYGRAGCGTAKPTKPRRGECDDGVVLFLKSGKQLKTEVRVSGANGRTGNTDNMGL